MQQSRVLFFAIIGLALLAVIGMVGAVYLFSDTSTPFAARQDSVTVEVIVPSSIQPWVADAAAKYNAANPNTTVKLISAAGLIPLEKYQSSNTPRPVGWPKPLLWLIWLNRMATILWAPLLWPVARCCGAGMPTS